VSKTHGWCWTLVHAVPNFNLVGLLSIFVGSRMDYVVPHLVPHIDVNFFLRHYQANGILVDMAYLAWDGFCGYIKLESKDGCHTMGI